jgi:hypothetical protein
MRVKDKKILFDYPLRSVKDRKVLFDYPQVSRNAFLEKKA